MKTPGAMTIVMANEAAQARSTEPGRHGRNEVAHDPVTGPAMG